MPSNFIVDVRLKENDTVSFLASLYGLYVVPMQHTFPCPVKAARARLQEVCLQLCVVAVGWASSSAASLAGCWTR